MSASRQRRLVAGEPVVWLERHDDELVRCEGRVDHAAGSYVLLRSPVDGSDLRLHASSVTRLSEAGGDEPDRKGPATRLAAAVRRHWRRARQVASSVVGGQPSKNDEEAG